MTGEFPPARIVLSDLDADRLAAARVAHGKVRTAAALEYRIAHDEEAGALLSGLPPGSLIIKATGMGKDRRGSPLPARAGWSPESIAWDLNYRGDLEFLAQARAVQRDRSLRVFDGWRYFLFGWTAHISEIFALQIDARRLRLLQARPSRSGRKRAESLAVRSPKRDRVRKLANA